MKKSFLIGLVILSVGMLVFTGSASAKDQCCECNGYEQYWFAFWTWYDGYECTCSEWCPGAWECTRKGDTNFGCVYHAEINGFNNGDCRFPYTCVPPKPFGPFSLNNCNGC